MAWQKVRIKIPKDFDPSERIEIAESIIEFIKERSQNGVGVKQRGSGFQNYKLPEYTKEYAKRKGQKNVDLVLSNEMLEEIKLLSHESGSVLIGFDNGSEVNDKAEGNQIGSYGRSPNPKKARRFLGIAKSDLDNLIDEFG